MFLAACACSGVETDTVLPADTEEYDPPSGEVTLLTDDGVSLVADMVPASEPGRPSVILLHMNPVAFDRTDWPLDFIEQLNANDWNLLVPDRRGAGESGGEPQDAIEGEGGRLDVSACVQFLADETGEGPFVIAGASNGTTSMIDYATWAQADALPPPAGLVFFTGGTYTETNTAMVDLPPLPSLFLYAADENEWSVAQQALAPPDLWTFIEYAEGDHGTLLLSAAPESADDAEGFIGELLTTP
jgi:pimeloyl-ACP methyl ester carboxylesterase